MSLRLEARPFEYEDLTEKQKEAVRKTVDLMNDAYEHMKHDKENRKKLKFAPFSIEIKNPNRMVFLSSGRGMGKTSVMMSLMNMPKLENLEPFENAVPVEKAKKQIEYYQFKEKYELLENNLIWLETIDLEPLPASTNLFAALLARIEALIDKNLTPQWNQYNACNNSTNLEDKKTDPRRLLKKLQDKAALGWNGNIKERGKVTTPQAFAEETKMAEQARLTLKDDFRELLEAVAEAFRVHCGKAGFDPIFVLPIDDFDLNPAVGIELARLLRAISAPRLFILAMGDLNVVELLLRIRLTQDILQQTSPVAIQGSPLEKWNEDIQTMASSLAGNAIRKLFPQSQRVYLDYMPLQEAIWYRPTINDRPLAELIYNIEFPKSLAFIDVIKSNNIGEFLCAPWTKNKFDKELEIFLKTDDPYKTNTPIEDMFYRGLTLFKAPIRHINDLWQKLDEIVPKRSKIDRPLTEKEKEKIYEKFFDGCAIECQYAIEEDDKLTFSNRSDAYYGITMGIGDAWNFSSQVFWGSRPRSPRIIPASSKCHIELSLITDMFISLRSNKNRFEKRGFNTLSSNYEDGNNIFSSRTEALLKVFHDICTFHHPNRLTGPNLTPNQTSLNWVCTAWDTGDTEFEIVRLSWPIPAWSSFWQFDRLSKRILRTFIYVIDEMIPDGRPYEQLWLYMIFQWIANICQIEDGCNQVPIEFPSDDNWISFVRDPLESLTKKYFEPYRIGSKLKKHKTQHSDGIRNWLILLSMLFSPEFAPPENWLAHSSFFDHKNIYLPENLLSVWRLTPYNYKESNLKIFPYREVNYFRQVRKNNISKFVNQDNYKYYKELFFSQQVYFNQYCPSLNPEIEL